MGEAEPAAAPAAVDEAALVAGLKARRPEAFETLVRMYTPRLLAVAMRMLGSTEDAQDVVQDAMLSAYRSIDRFEGNARVSTWLHRIVVNAALMKLRTRRRKPEEPLEPLLPTFLEDGHHAHDVTGWSEPADKTVERNQTRQIVRDAILDAAGHLQGRAHPARHPGREHRGDGEGAGHHAQRREDPVAPGAPGIARAAEHAHAARTTRMTPPARMTCRDLVEFMMDYLSNELARRHPHHLRASPHRLPPLRALPQDVSDHHHPLPRSLRRLR